MRSKLQYMSCILIISMLIDQGDGRWKERDKDNILRDMLMYKQIKIADKLEREIKEFYDEYPAGWIEEDIKDLHTYLSDSLSSKLEATNNNRNKNKIGNHFPVIENLDLNVTSGLNKKTPSNNTFRNLSEYSQPNTDWPKFDDILLAIGKKYDWKNDRWIKVKPVNKSKTKTKRHKNDENTIHNSEKHKFSYKIVKLLNKSKSRRNVVVAVSAVR